ncbi:MAG: hypothetical protein RI553_10620, partial [Salibaculum sp.]|uniref:hypothetical protein n=1 Tax=Salibaculum sp. TaxID=2855480 RepID=UPI002870A8CB
ESCASTTALRRTEGVRKSAWRCSDDRQHTLLMTYRAENGFGGMNIGEATALIDNETCHATAVIIE